MDVCVSTAVATSNLCLEYNHVKTQWGPQQPQRGSSG